MSSLNKLYRISIIWPEHTGAGTAFDPIQRYDNAKLLPRDESHFGFVLFAEENGPVHWVSYAFPVHIEEMPKEPKESE